VAVEPVRGIDVTTDGASLAGHADPAHSEGSIHATRDSAKEIVALLRSLINSVKC